MVGCTKDIPRRKRGIRGFTLIELLVVIAIIGLFASILLASLSSARAHARYGTMVAQMREIAIAAEIDHGPSRNCSDPNTGSTYSSTYACDVREGDPPSFVGSTLSSLRAPPCSIWLYFWDNLTSFANGIIRISVRNKDGGPTIFYYCLDKGNAADCSEGAGVDFRTYLPKAIYCTE